MNDAFLHNNDDGEIGIVEYFDFSSKETFTFVNGKTISGFNVRYETYGRLNKDKSNAILICHALTGDHHCSGVHSLMDKKTGWWNNMIGPGKPIDTTKFFVICSNCLGGCQGTTGPRSINPQTGKPYNLDFPAFSIKDMVNLQEKLISHLGIEKLYAVIGGSMGGMQALEWAIAYPDKLEKMIVLASTARQSVQTIAFNEVGRTAILNDVNFNNGSYTEKKSPKVGLAVARMMAHITYLSDKGLEKKFGRVKNKKSDEIFSPEFEIENYLHYQGQSFVNRFDANTYLYLTKALDSFDLYNNKELYLAFKNIKASSLVVAFTSDWLFPPSQNKDIALSLLKAGKNASYALIESSLGHDSFLVKSKELNNLIFNFLGEF